MSINNSERFSLAMPYRVNNIHFKPVDLLYSWGCRGNHKPNIRIVQTVNRKQVQFCVLALEATRLQTASCQQNGGNSEKEFVMIYVSYRYCCRNIQYCSSKCKLKASINICETFKEGLVFTFQRCDETNSG